MKPIALYRVRVYRLEPRLALGEPFDLHRYCCEVERSTAGRDVGGVPYGGKRWYASHETSALAVKLARAEVRWQLKAARAGKLSCDEAIFEGPELEKAEKALDSTFVKREVVSAPNARVTETQYTLSAAVQKQLQIHAKLPAAASGPDTPGHKPLSADFASRMESLVKGAQVDLDEPIDGEVDTRR